MKSKFSSILKVKKRSLDLARSRLLKSKNALNLAQENFDLARNSLVSINMPLKGDSKNIALSMMQSRSCRDELNRAKERLDIAQKELMHFEHLYKQANLEFERINYLHEQEVKMALKAIEKSQANLLDEFGVMAFARKALL